MFRAYYGAPLIQTSSGREVGATRTFLQSLNNFCKREDVTHVGVAFDTVIESFRNKLFDGYKTGEGLHPEIYTQFPIVEEATKALGAVCWSMIDFEADDAIATAAHKFAKLKSVEQVVICSPDKDFAQCLTNPKIVCWDRLRDVYYDRQAATEKFGVEPESIPDYLGLVGDDADGIPGIPKWGKKSAATLLAQYRTIENIPADYESWSVKVRGAKGLSEVLEANRQNAALYKKLATLRFDVPLSEKIGDLKLKGQNPALLKKLCKTLEFERFSG